MNSASANTSAFGRISGTIQQCRNTAELGQNVLHRIGLGEVNVPAHLKELDHGLEIGCWIDLTKSHQDGLLDQVAGYRFRTLQLPFILQLDLSGDRRNGRIDVA